MNFDMSKKLVFYFEENGKPRRYRTTGKLKECFLLVRDQVTVSQAEEFIDKFNQSGVLIEGRKAKFIGLYDSTEK